MKNTIRILNLVLCICLFASCSKNKSDEQVSADSDYFVYPIENVTTAFDVDTTGTLYYTNFIDSGKVESYIDKNGKTIITPIMQTELYAYDFEGKLQNSYIMNNRLGTNCLAIDHGKAYYTTSTSSIGSKSIKTTEPTESNDITTDIKETTITTFYEFSMENQSTRELCQLNTINSIQKITVIDGYLYYIGINNDKINKEYTLTDENDTFYYSGEVIGVIDTKEKTTAEIPVDFPITFTKTQDNNLMIFAHDDEQGYYFTNYNIKKKSLSKKIYHDPGYKFNNFVIYNKNNDFIYNTRNTSKTSLTAVSLKDADKTTELMPDVGANYMVCQGDYTYYSNHFNSGQIERIKSSAYIRGGKTIRMVSSLYPNYTPFGCGYSINRQYPDKESFSLSVLSQDDNFDVCLMSSRDDISLNIKDKGSFYPLNKVDGVKEFLDACFPYLKSTATTTEGDVWMLPVSVDIPCLLYNESFCKDNGINLSSPIDFESFMESLVSLRQNSVLNGTYNYSSYLLTENYFYQYLSNSTDFNTKNFQSLAERFKKELNYEKDASSSDSFTEIHKMLSSSDISNFLFDLEYYQMPQMEYSINNSIRASALPYITENHKNIATVTYLCVNPSSDNLKETLQYISSLCKFIIEDKNTLIFKDRSKYSNNLAIDDLYNIYTNGDIQFTIPSELFMDDYEEYLNDKIDLPTLVKEANRKVETFFKE